MRIAFAFSAALCGLLSSSIAAQNTSAAAVPTYLPIPSSAASVPLNAAGYALENFGNGAFMVTEGVYQALFIVSTTGVALIDAPPTIGQKILFAIGNTTHLPVTHLIYSHSHADHIGGASLITAAYPNATIIAHADTFTQLNLTGDPTRPLPTKTFQDEYKLRAANQTLQLSYKGINHIPGNIFIYHSASKTLMLVDIVFPGWVPFDRLGEVSYVPGFIKAHDQILAYDFVHYVGGHLSRSGTRDDVQTQKNYVTDLFGNCKAAIEASATDDPVLGAQKIVEAALATNPGNSWAEFRTYLDVVDNYCANVTGETWDGVLAGVDVFGESNANVMVESLRIDYGVVGPFGAV